jgi:adenylate cyclase
MDFSSVRAPVKANALVSFMDIQGFNKASERLGDPLAVFGFLDDWAAVVAGVIEAGGGKVIKYIGDACLSVFPEGSADAGVRALLRAKADSERFFADRGIPTRLRVSCHFGEVAIGPFGPAGAKRLDVMGDAVNVAATIDRADRGGRMTISPQAFRQLEPETRKLFKKYTPPIVYVADEG